MRDSLTRATLFVVYQLTILVGIVLLPVTVLAQRLGLTVPAGRLVERLGDSYESFR